MKNRKILNNREAFSLFHLELWSDINQYTIVWILNISILNSRWLRPSYSSSSSSSFEEEAFEKFFCE